MCASLISNDNTIFQRQWGSVLDIGIELHVTRSTHRLCDTYGRRKRTRHKAEVIVVHQLTYRVCSLACVVGMVDEERMPFAQELLVALAVLEVRVPRHLVILTYIIVLHTLLQFGYVRSVLLHLLIETILSAADGILYIYAESFQILVSNQSSCCHSFYAFEFHKLSISVSVKDTKSTFFTYLMSAESGSNFWFNLLSMVLIVLPKSVFVT